LLAQRYRPAPAASEPCRRPARRPPRSTRWHPGDQRPDRAHRAAGTASPAARP